MPDVAKLKKRALEYEQKKQFDKALDTYTQVLAELDEHVDEADVALYNRVGDLLLRRGDVSEAVDHYEKAVDLYTDGGFFNNAIALCNKILRNAPGRNSIYYKLGKISARKGFINDAKQNFLEYADRMQKAGQLEEAFRALKEFADLCPDQDDIRLMLADQLVRKDRKSEAIEQLHALYDKFSAEGRSAEARATVDRMKALDPALEPKETVRAAPAKTGDLIFLDVNYDPPKRPAVVVEPAPAPVAASVAQPPIEPMAAPIIEPVAAKVAAPPAPQVTAATSTQQTEARPTTPVATSSVAIEMPVIEPDEDILIDLDAVQPADVAPLQGLSHGAILPDGRTTPSENIVSHVDVGLITGFEDSAASEGAPDLLIAPVEGLEMTSHSGDADADAPPTRADVSSMLDAMDHEDVAAIELPSRDVPSSDVGSPELPTLEIEDGSSLGGELPMLDVPIEAEEDDGAPIGGALTFLSINSTGEMAVIPDPVSEQSADLVAERAPAPDNVAPPMPEPRVSGQTHTGYFDDVAFDVERTPSIELDAIVPDGGPPLPLLDVDEHASTTFDREHALAGLPMLDADQLEPHGGEQGDVEEEEESVELLWQTEPGDAPRPEGSVSSRVPSSTPASSPLSRVDQLRLDVSHAPESWDLHRQLAEALLEQGDRSGGITELEATMFGYEREGNLADARRSAEELIRVEPNSVRYHQKRVEYAVRANDKPQLVDAYLALAESLFRSGQLDKSRAVYGRVLELAPDDARAASALSELGAEIDEAQSESASEQDREHASDKRAAWNTPETDRTSLHAVPLAVEVERTATTLPIDEELFAALETPLPEPPKRASVPTPPSRPAIAASGDEDFVNLSDWLREDEAPKSTRMVASGEAAPEVQQDFADMLSKFKQGVTSNVDDTDHESHYDLGIAYKEMGLLDEAISEFQKALRGTEHRVRTYEALGQCFVEKRQYQIAMTILLRALDEAGASDDTLVGVLYLLGYASESLQKWEDAVGYYERVFAVDIQFRDIGDRLSAVERKARK
ncbi:MAG: tetratricopeptide repeat protein [Gemmatimonas sp.]